MPKYLEIAELVRNRLARGEYPGGKLPPLRKLASDMGVSYLTARHAVRTLKEAGWNRTRAARPLVAMVTPLWAFTEWHRAVRNGTEALGGQVRFISYASDTDPNISAAINENEYDLVFLSLPDREDSRLLELVSKENDRVVVMFRDLSSYGIRSIVGADPACIERFLELLAARGHRRIDAFGRDNDIRAGAGDRYRIWRNWLERHGIEGRFHEMKHLPFEPDDVRAADFCRRRLAAREFADAVFCFNPTLASGFYRACFEHGLVPGRDISVFAFGDQEKAMLMTPALATVMNVGVEETIREIIAEYCPEAVRSDKVTFRLKHTLIHEGESIIRQYAGGES
ncbi:MAG: substrate-binding domain-containing protein [Lentisphaeria bacterium]|nr:substrate-binding domain-containing protein [Lentisphaeria bacterium]